MAPALAPPVSTLLAEPPVVAKDPHELSAVLGAQAAEARSLRAQLAEGHRECLGLQHRLRDSMGEISAAAEATAGAAERLEAHAGRQGLVLAAGVERSRAERAALEADLQRLERLLWERDREIARLRDKGRELEAERLQGELELTGLAVAHEAASAEVRSLGAGVAELRRQQQLGVSQATRSEGIGGSSGDAPVAAASPEQVARTQETAARLEEKRKEHAALRRRAEELAKESRQLEAKAGAFTERVQAFEGGLRARQSQFEAHDERLIKEAIALRDRVNGLWNQLLDEQRDSSGVEQRYILKERCSEEKEDIQRQMSETVRTLKSLSTALRSSGREVRSPEVPGDPLDEQLHAFLRSAVSHQDPLPPLIWRLAYGDYLLGQDRVTLGDAHGRLMVRRGAAGATPLRDYLRSQAQQATQKSGATRAPNSQQRQWP